MPEKLSPNPAYVCLLSHLDLMRNYVAVHWEETWSMVQVSLNYLGEILKAKEYVH